MAYSEIINNTKNILEIVAISMAAIFFIYKLLGWWLFVNVAVEPERTSIPKNIPFDYLAITLNIEKKDTGSVVLESVIVRVSDLINGDKIAILPLAGIGKLEYTQPIDVNNFKRSLWVLFATLNYRSG